MNAGNQQPQQQMMNDGSQQMGQQQQQQQQQSQQVVSGGSQPRPQQVSFSDKRKESLDSYHESHSILINIYNDNRCL